MDIVNNHHVDLLFSKFSPEEIIDKFHGNPTYAPFITQNAGYFADYITSDDLSWLAGNDYAAWDLVQDDTLIWHNLFSLKSMFSEFRKYDYGALLVASYQSILRSM